MTIRSSILAKLSGKRLTAAPEDEGKVELVAYETPAPPIKGQIVPNFEVEDKYPDARGKTNVVVSRKRQNRQVEWSLQSEANRNLPRVSVKIVDEI